MLLSGRPCTVALDAASLDLPEAEICRYMGYGDHEPDPRVRDMIAAMKAQLPACSTPCYGCLRVEGRALDRRRLALGGVTVTPGPIITNCLRDGESFIVLIATAGESYDRWREQSFEPDDIVSRYVADALGSALVEAVVARALADLDAEADTLGIRISNSYSPGYCEWHVSGQQALFSLLPDRFCGVRLTESSLMLPIKSVSAVIAAGPDVVRKPYGCAICRRKDCFKRRLDPARTARMH